MDRDHERQLNLLRIVCCVAWADGDVSEQERQLLMTLVSRHFAREEDADPIEAATRQLTAWRVDESALEEAVNKLEQDEDRLFALKLAYMMAKVSQRPQDSEAINAEEKAVYRRLVDSLGLNETQVNEAEWAAEEELSSGRSIWALLGSAFAELGTWPSREMLETPGMQWL